MTMLQSSSCKSSCKVTAEIAAESESGLGTMTGVVSCDRTQAALILGTDATTFNTPLGQAKGKSGIGLDYLEFGEGGS